MLRGCFYIPSTPLLLQDLSKGYVIENMSVNWIIYIYILGRLNFDRVLQIYNVLKNTRLTKIILPKNEKLLGDKFIIGRVTQSTHLIDYAIFLYRNIKFFYTSNWHYTCVIKESYVINYFLYGVTQGSITSQSYKHCALCLFTQASFYLLTINIS